MAYVFYKEGNLFETEEEARNASKRFTNKTFDRYDSSYDYDLTVERYEANKHEGMSDADALSEACGGDFYRPMQ